MIIELKNNHMEADISTTGAELKSLRKTNDIRNVEYLWQLNPQIWERQAPLLFPLIGRLKDGEYTYEGKTYKTEIHGFARFREFAVINREETSVTLETTSDEDTKKEYPFDFILRITYRLDGNGLVKEHSVENTGNTPIYYEIGGHEGYNLALFEGEAMEDYYIEFPDTDHLMTYVTDSDVMIEKDKVKVSLEEGRLYLSPEVFKDDALIMDNFSKRTVYLCNTRNDRRVTVEFNDFKYLGIWTKYMRGNYVCIEPWSSLPDCNYLGKELTAKKDIRILEAGAMETLAYTMKID